MIKYRYFLDFEKEEQWLNRMARQGYEFTGKNMFSGYSFRRSQPKETCIRITVPSKGPKIFRTIASSLKTAAGGLLPGAKIRTPSISPGLGTVLRTRSFQTRRPKPGGISVSLTCG